MTSRFELDSMEISRIQFHTDLTQKAKNHLIGKIEKRMCREEDNELNGHSNGYYND